MLTRLTFLSVLILAVAMAAAGQDPVFRTETSLQSLAVHITDKQGRDITGLAASDFTVLEDGRPQKISFFGSEKEPISLAILVDTSTSMQSGQKLARVRTLLGPLIMGDQPEDEIFLVPFTDRPGSFQALNPAQRAHPPDFESASRGSTALYDAVASALCRMRTAKNLRQAIVVITDGADQNSRLRREQLIQLARSSRPQIFMVGFFDTGEASLYRASARTVTLVSGHEIDNPMQAFADIAKESGAEASWPESESDLRKVIEHVLGILRAQYTLAYYSEETGKPRRIQIRVSRPDTIIAAQRTATTDATDSAAIHFDLPSCEVSPVDHKYPWEALVTGWDPQSQAALQTITWQDNFSRPTSGWPNRADSRYHNRAYEISRDPPGSVLWPGRGQVTSPSRPDTEGSIAAYGPYWEDFRASITVSVDGNNAKGMIFRMNNSGCYLFLVRPDRSFKLQKRFWPSLSRDLIPWTSLPSGAGKHGDNVRLTVEDQGDRIRLFIDGALVATTNDSTFDEGYVGMVVFGVGRTLFRDLDAEGSAVHSSLPSRAAK